MKTRIVIMSTILASLLAACTGKQPSPARTNELIGNNDSLSKKIITASLTLKEENVSDFLEAAKSMIESSNAEAGCESYMFYQDPYEKTKFIAIEFWKNQTAIDSHNNSPHFIAFMEKTGAWLSVPAEIKVIDVLSE